MKSFILCFISVCITILKANVSSEEYKDIHTGVLYNGEGYMYAFPAQCSEILNEFAQYASNFTMCSIQYARPIKLCEKCIEHYIKFDSKYQELKNTVANGTSCLSIFISHDRLDAVLEYHDNILSVWTKANCNACYDWTGKIPVLANNTKRFNKMYNDTMECIRTNINPERNNSDVVCEKCMQSYVQLDNYYKSLSSDTIGVDIICMDVVDSMNATRSIWSKGLNCCKHRSSPENIMFLCSTAVISVLPLLYYLAVRFCGPIRDLPNVLKQSRFRQTILGSVDGRMNQR